VLTKFVTVVLAALRRVQSKKDKTGWEIGLRDFAILKKGAAVRVCMCVPVSVFVPLTLFRIIVSPCACIGTCAR